MLIDSHCHLDYPELSDDLNGTLARAENAGVKGMLAIATDLGKTETLLHMAEAHANIYTSVGVHPHEAEKITEPQLKEHLVGLSKHPKVVAFGETGLDYYYEHSPRDQQQKAFEAHIEAGIEAGLPLIVHTREAEEDTIRFLKEVGLGQARGVIHCFSGSEWLAQEALALGFYISVSGIVTFKKAEALRKIISHVPLDRLLVETDAPYLAPVPHRGKPNEPAFVRYVAEKLAEIKGISISECEAETTENFYKVFTKVSSFDKS